MDKHPFRTDILQMKRSARWTLFSIRNSCTKCPGGLQS